jgi:hypothetical protein
VYQLVRCNQNEIRLTYLEIGGAAWYIVIKSVFTSSFSRFSLTLLYCGEEKGIGDE